MEEYIGSLLPIGPEQIFQLGRQCLHKDFTVAGPSAGIRNFEYGTMPFRLDDRPRHVAPDRPQQSHNGSGLKAADSAGERKLAREAGSATRLRVQMVDRVGTGVDQVAARGLKNRQEPVVSDRGIDHAKSISHRPVQPGISLVEEAPRRRRGLSNE
jgi:hypothetical protein